MERFKILRGRGLAFNNLLRGVPVGKKEHTQTFTFFHDWRPKYTIGIIGNHFLYSINKSKEAPSRFSTSLEISFQKDLMIHSVLSLNRRENRNCLV